MNPTASRCGTEWCVKASAIAGGITALMVEYGETMDKMSRGNASNDEIERMRILRAQIAEEEKRFDALLPSGTAAGDQPGQLLLFKNQEA